ncbi:MAG: hypothetical protein WD988_04490 [Candidatus Curtissbacteria bacterium]
MSKSAIGVVGIGEVGLAISKIFASNFVVLKKDLDFDELEENKVEVLHICLPYNNNFEDTVIAQAKANKPDLIVIHSTVKPGTTKSIAKKVEIPIVHSPVMGTHPSLEKDVREFTKFIGPADNKSKQLAINHFRDVGIKTKVLESPLETELGKLLDTTYYAWNIIFEKLTWQICNAAGANFENVYTQFNQVYNQGYGKSKPNVLRPVLKHQQGAIGGHCLIPNTQILASFTKTPLVDFLLEENNKL